MREALENLCDAIADTEMHGDGAHDEDCSVCKAHQAARAALSTKQEAGAKADKRYTRLLQSFTELQAAAQHVVDETDRIHDSDPWPTKYRAPYDAITKLRTLLLGQYGLRSLSTKQEGEGSAAAAAPLPSTAGAPTASEVERLRAEVADLTRLNGELADMLEPAEEQGDGK